jgi:acetylornithine/succinyldiaminopimelate/putrescine aminotransferase/nucleoside-diphosphate-sugar epimerase
MPLDAASSNGSTPTKTDPGAPPARGEDPLGILAEAELRTGETLDLAARHLDSSLVDVLRILGFDKTYASARGSYLYDGAGRAYLDFHTGEGFASLGHNHPDVRGALRATLASDLVDGVQIHYSVLAGMLAEALSQRLPRGLDATFFTSSGAEAVDAAMKFARAATGRARFISCTSGFHGVTLGPLSLVGDEFFKDGFGPLLSGCQCVPFGDLERLEAQLRGGDAAAFIVEPIQGRMVTPPPTDYLQEAQELCRHYGTMFVIDEVQTGLGRTGRWFALEHWGLAPDFVLVGKALSGGCVPVAAMVTRREIYQRAVGTLDRSYVHQSTFGRNRLSMAAGLATIRIIERDRLLERAVRMNAVLTDGLAELQRRHEMIADVRGGGLMLGIELGAPSSRVGRLNARLFHMASPGLFPQLVVIPLHRDHRVITMAAGKNDVIKLVPPLTLSEGEASRFLDALDAVLADCESTGSKNWSVVRDIATATLRRKVSEDPPANGRRQPLREHAGRARGEVCLVTGATGFIGGRLARRLVDEGRPVRCLVRRSSDTSRLERLGVELAVGDLTDAPSLERAADGAGYVFHCAALVSDWATTREITQTNVVGTRNLIEASIAATVRRFVHFSTTDVYGHPDAAAVDETYASSRFSNWYAQTKLAAERELRRAHAADDLDIVVLRPATVYGPGSTDVVGEIARAIGRRSMLLIDGGRAIAGLCFIDNLLDAAVLALEHDAAPGRAFNISDGLDITWREFTDGLADGLGYSKVRWSVPYWIAHGVGFSLESGYRLMRKTTGMDAPVLLSRQAVQVLGRNQDFSNRTARALLGWEPRVDYSSGLEATVAWLRTEYLSNR